MDINPAISASLPSGETKEPKRRIIPKHGTPESNAKKIILVALDVVREHQDATDLEDVKELLKHRCASLHLAYDSEVVGLAAEAALARRSRRQI